jgi:hypothetical protein
MARGNFLSVDAQASSDNGFFVVRSWVVSGRNEKWFVVQKKEGFRGLREFGGENFDELATSPTLWRLR